MSKVYIVEAWENMPYGEYYGIFRVYSTLKKAESWVEEQEDKETYDYTILEEEVYD